jgi:hypothetical protein
MTNPEMNPESGGHYLRKANGELILLPEIEEPTEGQEPETQRRKRPAPVDDKE